jgi:two-component system sensor kinase FixL
MSWVTVVWSMNAAACLTLALMHVVIWWNDRAARANLVFAVMATAVAVFAAFELAMMHAETPMQFGVIVRWLHVPGWVIIASLVAFVRLYLRAGRRSRGDRRQALVVGECSSPEQHSTAFHVGKIFENC